MKPYENDPYEEDPTSEIQSLEGPRDNNDHLQYLLTAYAFDNISDEGRQEVESHLKECTGCRQELDSLRKTLELVEEGLEEGRENYAFEERRRQRVLQAASKRRGPVRRFFFRHPALALAAAILLLCLPVVGVITSFQVVRLGDSERVQTVRLESRKMAPSRVEPLAGEPEAQFDAPQRRETQSSSNMRGLGLQDQVVTGGADDFAALTNEELSRIQTHESSAERRSEAVAESALGSAELPEAELAEAPAVVSGHGMSDSSGEWSAQRPESEMAQAPTEPPADTDLSLYTAPRTVAPRATRAKNAEGLAEDLKKQFGRTSQLAPTVPEAALDVAMVSKESEEAPGVAGTYVPQLQAGRADYYRYDTNGIQSDGRSRGARRQSHGGLYFRSGREEGEKSEEETWERFAERQEPAAAKDGESESRFYGAERRRRGRVLKEALGDQAGAADGGELADRNSNLATVVEEDEAATVEGGGVAQSEEVPRASTRLRENKKSAQIPEGLLALGDELRAGTELKALTSEDAAPPDESEHGAVDISQDGRGTGEMAGAGPRRYLLELEKLQQVEDLSELAGKPATGGTTSGQLGGQRRSLGWGFSQPTALEKLLSAYSNYAANDPDLDFDSFAANFRAVPAPQVGDEGLGREGFRQRYGTNPFVDTRRDRLSTFAMDVDTASFTLVRNVLAAGGLPPASAVRVEEFVNFLPQAYPSDPQEVFSVTCDGMPSVFGSEGVDLLRIGIKARDLRPGERRNAVLTLAVDVSGSMGDRSRLELVKSSLEVLVGSLAPTDQVALVAFSGQASLVLPHTPARNAERIRGAIRSLTAGGGTNVEAGLELSYRIAHEALSPVSLNRVILLSDGVANLGARGPEEILKSVRFFATKGIYLSAIGVGRGKFNDRMLEFLSNQGNGICHYLDDISEAQRIFRQNLPAQLEVLAADAKVQVDFHPEAVSHYRLLGYENRDVRDQDFRNDKVDAGEVGPGTTVTALYEIVRRPGWTGPLGKVYLRYLDTARGRVVERDYPVPQGVISTAVESASTSLRLLACAAELAELLRGSYYARDGSFGDVLAQLEALGSETPMEQERRQLLTMARQAQQLKIQQLSSLIQEKGSQSPTPSER